MNSFYKEPLVIIAILTFMCLGIGAFSIGYNSVIDTPAPRPTKFVSHLVCATPTDCTVTVTKEYE